MDTGTFSSSLKKSRFGIPFSIISKKPIISPPIVKGKKKRRKKT